MVSMLLLVTCEGNAGRRILRMYKLKRIHIIATPFTQAGYVGEDVEMVIHRLLQVEKHVVH